MIDFTPRGPKPRRHRACGAEARVLELEAAMHAIMRVTDPGDIRVRLGLLAWEHLTPARKIARESLGLKLGGRVKVDGKWVDYDETAADS